MWEKLLYCRFKNELNRTSKITGKKKEFKYMLVEFCFERIEEGEKKKECISNEKCYENTFWRHDYVIHLVNFDKIINFDDNLEKNFDLEELENSDLNDKKPRLLYKPSNNYFYKLVKKNTNEILRQGKLYISIETNLDIPKHYQRYYLDESKKIVKRDGFKSDNNNYLDGETIDYEVEKYKTNNIRLVFLQTIYQEDRKTPEYIDYNPDNHDLYVSKFKNTDFTNTHLFN